MMITKKMTEAAKAVIAQWDTPNWKLTEPTAKLIEELRKAVNEAAISTDVEPLKMRVSEEMVEAAHMYICRLYPYPQSKPETRQMLQEAWNVAAPPAQATTVKALKWDEFSTELSRYFQYNTILGQYQISYLGDFECWQLYSPQKSSIWKENFSRHKSSDEAKVEAQTDYEARIRSALS